jgi:phospholipid/cholesterol/gamma-HCH transport system substrate-binding protein
LETKTNYAVVGLFVLILTGALIATGLWLSVGFGQKKYNTYAVYIHEAVSGLSEQSTVKFNGVPVGHVQKIKLNALDPQQVKILLSIEEGTPITTSTTATLLSQGITGNTYVGLSANSSDLTPLKKMANEPYPIIPNKPSLFNQLDTVLKTITDDVSSVSKRINAVLDEENAQNWKKTLGNFQKFSSTIANNNENLDKIIKSTEVLTHNLSKSSKEIPKLINKLETMATSVSEAGTKVGDTMDSAKAVTQKLSQQTLPPLVSLIHKLDNISANLQHVSEQMRQNPSVVIRGTTAPKPGPGESP